MPGTRSEVIKALLHLKGVIDALKKMEKSTFTETEQQAIRETLNQAYDRASYLLVKLDQNQEEKR